jgi:putative transposase
MLPRRPERLNCFDYLGEYSYFLTYCTDYRHEAFVQAVRVDAVRTHILRAASDERFAVAAYCFMPDHLHLLVTGEQPSSDCRRFIALSKQLSGFYYQRAFGRRLWQRYGYEHVLRSEEDVLSVARYIVENPVRARIADSVQHYPFSGSALYSVEEILDSLPWSPRQKRSRNGSGSGSG